MTRAERNAVRRTKAVLGLRSDLLIAYVFAVDDMLTAIARSGMVDLVPYIRRLKRLRRKFAKC